MEHLARDPTPRTRVHHLMAEGISFKVTVALRARRVEKWIRAVKRDYLDNAPIKCVGLDCEFTNPREGDQRTAVLQLSVASENLVLQICHADEVPQVLREFLQDRTIRSCGAAIGKDVEMMSPYGIYITSAYDFQKILPNLTSNHILSLYDLANSIIGTNLEKKKRKKYKKKDTAQEKEDELIFGWANVPLSYEQVRYAAMDAHLGFEMARSY
ncbi:3'-5' exonuclease-like [Lolium perenne]|uniref:3'-5' exonuclease-like n=1 Tax=Lolium perenne TaxID=4522 RepID=UPI0021F5621F|nr:3'-5' exonuclease-like [Lolium perenne]